MGVSQCVGIGIMKRKSTSVIWSLETFMRDETISEIYMM